MTLPSASVRETIYFSGRVQGVGFRWTTNNIAKRFDVSGFVRNLDDGRVELVAESTPAELQAFVQEIKTAMGGNIREITVDTSPATAEFSEFKVRT